MKLPELISSISTEFPFNLPLYKEIILMRLRSFETRFHELNGPTKSLVLSDAVKALPYERPDPRSSISVFKCLTYCLSILWGSAKVTAMPNSIFAPRLPSILMLRTEEGSVIPLVYSVGSIDTLIEVVSKFSMVTMAESFFFANPY